MAMNNSSFSNGTTIMKYYIDDTVFDPNFQRVTVPIVFGTIVLLGCLGNLLVIIVVLSKSKAQNTTDILIVNLAFADLLFVICCLPFTAVANALGTWPFGDIWCNISNYLVYVCAFESVYTLVLMSSDRYLAVVHPITSIKIRNRRNAIMLVFLTWIVILGANIPLVFLFHVIELPYFGNNRVTCSLSSVDAYFIVRTHHACFFVFGYVLPLTLITVSYGFMLKRLLYGVVPGGSQKPENIRSKKRVTKMIFIVVAVFAFCWLPIQILFMIQYFGHFPSRIVYFYIYVTCLCLAYMNSCVNPILYAFMSKNFRRAFQKLIGCK